MASIQVSSWKPISQPLACANVSQPLRNGQTFMSTLQTTVRIVFIVEWEILTPLAQAQLVVNSKATCGTMAPSSAEGCISISHVFYNVSERTFNFYIVLSVPRVAAESW